MSSCVLILYLLFLAGSSGGLLLTWGFALAVFSLGLLAPFAAVAVLLLKDRRAYRWRIGIDAPNHSRRGEVLRVELNRAQATGGLDLGLICVECHDTVSIAFDVEPIVRAVEDVAYQHWIRLDDSVASCDVHIPTDQPTSYEGKHFSIQWRIEAWSSPHSERLAVRPVWVSW